MGWLGWSERDALDADVNSILVAMEGKLEFLNPGLKKSGKVPVAAKWRDFAKSHNARVQASRGKTK